MMTSKITKVTKLNAIKALVSTGSLPQDVTPEMVIELCDKLIESCTKKSTSKADEAKHKANAAAIEKIVEVLTNSEKGMTVGEICVAIGDPSSQHVTALVTSVCSTEKKPIENPLLKREMNGRKAIFSIA